MIATMIAARAARRKRRETRARRRPSLTLRVGKRRSIRLPPPQSDYLPQTISLLSGEPEKPPQKLPAREHRDHGPQQIPPTLGLGTSGGQRRSARRLDDFDVCAGQLVVEGRAIDPLQVTFGRIDVGGKEQRVAAAVAASQLQLVKAVGQ